MIMTTCDQPIGWPIELCDVTLQIEGSTILHQLNLCLKPADCPIVLLGKNGAGKSQLLRLLHGLCTPSHGTIHWHGEAKTSQVGLYQHHLLLAAQQMPLRCSVAQYLDLCLRLRDEARHHRRTRHARGILVQQALAQAGLEALAERPARRLSSGQRQCLMLSVANTIDCQTLLLDEPIAHLDPIMAQQVIAMIKGFCQAQRLLIMVSHDGAHIRNLARTIVFLEQGQLLLHMPAQDFFSPQQYLPKAAKIFRDSMNWGT